MKMKIKYTVNNYNRNCDMCGCTIDENVWHAEVVAGGVIYRIHDNIQCLEVLKYHLGLPYNRFYISISPGN